MCLWGIVVDILVEETNTDRMMWVDGDVDGVEREQQYGARELVQQTVIVRA